MGKTDKNLLVLGFLFLLALQACNDIIEKDISKKVMTMQSPPDNFVSKSYNIFFGWNEVEGAQNYHLQIVQPSFDSIQKLVLDTFLHGDKYIFTMYPGKYQWRIRAENNGSVTPFITRNIVVDSNSDFSNQTFAVNLPADNYVINNNVITFNWSPFPFATSYEYTLWDTSGNVRKIKNSTEQFVLDTLSEGKYKWKVRALNSTNNTATQFSPARYFTVDLTAPSPSTPELPLNNSLDSNGLSITWNRPDDVYADSLLVSSDSTFQSIVTGIYVSTVSSYQLQPLPINHVYYWKLRSKDVAGNWSSYSVAFRFTIVF